MSRENDFYTRITGDSTIMALLTGGVYKAETVGIEGISREQTPSAFDANGYLKPCCLVKQRGEIPDGTLLDPIAQVMSVSQVVECWLYQDRLYTTIDSAGERLKYLFIGYMFSDSFEIMWVNTLDRVRDKGALKGCSMKKIDFQVKRVWTP